MRLYELTEPPIYKGKGHEVPLDIAPENAVMNAMAGNFKEFDNEMWPLLQDKGRVHWLYWELRKRAGLDFYPGADDDEPVAQAKKGFGQKVKDFILDDEGNPVEAADNKNAEEYRQKGLRGEFGYSGWG